MKTDMESIAQLAGIKAKETDKVSVEFTKKSIAIFLFALEDYLESIAQHDGLSGAVKDVCLKLKNANPDWEF